VGESLVVHLGDGDWMVVDSFVDRQTGRPVALDYLTRLGLSPEKVLRHIVISHWHDDHMSTAT
jgi:glyoxylase-like metal-dependent hydrolase (beta-lactamase superfamily II)